MQTYKQALDFLTQHKYLEYTHAAELLSYIYQIDIRVVCRDILNILIKDV